MQLHIPPNVMGEMYYYDIKMLYNRYEQYIKEENENSKTQQEEYESSMEQPDPGNIQNQMSSMMHQSMDTITRGFTGLK